MRRHRPFAAVWARLKETPLELTISALVAVAGVLTMVYEWHALSWEHIAVDVLLVVGGAATIWGRFTDDVDVESAGLALQVAAFVFVFIQNIGSDARLGLEAVLGLILNVGALVAGFGVRLYVVRIAARARREAARGGPSSYAVH